MNSIWNGINNSGIHLNSNNNRIYSSTISSYTTHNQSLLINNSDTNDITTTKITKIILIFFISLMSLMTIFGNMLVIIAFIRESTIRTYSNYFILNLSIADLLIGLIW
jgi:hypothetical protein